MPIYYILGAIGLALLVIGASYAALIYHSPAPPGWTWISVVVGDAVTDLGMMFAIFVILVYLDALHLWPLFFVPPVAHLLTGGPMIAGQVLKKRRDGEYAKGLQGKYRGNE